MTLDALPEMTLDALPEMTLDALPEIEPLGALYHDVANFQWYYVSYVLEEL